MLPQAAAPGTRVPFPSVACPSGCSVGCDSFCPAPTAGDDTSQALRSKVSGSSPLGGCGPTHFYGSGLVFHRSGRCCPLARDVQAGAPDLGWEDSGPACASPAETPENSPLGPARNSGSPPPPPHPDAEGPEAGRRSGMPLHPPGMCVSSPVWQERPRPACPCEGERQRALEQTHGAEETGEYSTREEGQGASGKHTHVHSPECKTKSQPRPAMRGLCVARGRSEAPGLSRHHCPWRWEKRGTTSPWGPER